MIEKHRETNYLIGKHAMLRELRARDWLYFTYFYHMKDNLLSSFFTTSRYWRYFCRHFCKNPEAIIKILKTVKKISVWNRADQFLVEMSRIVSS